jgi:hypothetical protein
MVTAFAQRVLTGIGPGFADRAGGLLEPMVHGLTSELAATDALVSPAGPGDAWPLLFDLDTTPYPTWLGQAVGTRVPGGLNRQQAREYIRDRRAWRRGTPGAIRAAVAAQLRGSRRVELVERDGTPWRLTVQVYESEVPAGDPGPLLAAAVSQKPTGIVVEVEILPGATYAHQLDEHGPTYADFTAEFGTYDLARDHVPEA